TPPRGDAVSFDYRERASPGRGLSPLRSCPLPGARIPAFAGMTDIASAPHSNLVDNVLKTVCLKLYK
ncbi:MAG: hypothetical protein ACLQVJ_03535, partial [Syntrophobacteraceae bacterium]